MTANVSSTNNFELTKNQICTLALQGCGVLGAEETPQSSDLNYAALMLNGLMKTWEADNMGNWAQTEATLFLTPGQAIYSIGTPNPANASSVNVVETTLEVASALGSSTLEVTSISADGISLPATMLVGDNIGIVQTDGTCQWTTITNIASEIITIAATLTVGAALGTQIYSFTSVMSRPMNITQVRFRNSDGVDRQLTSQSRSDYYLQPTKFFLSEPLAYYYDFQLNNGTLILWPVPQDATGRLKFTYVRTLEDIVNAGDNPDFPQEFLLPLVVNLTAILTFAYGKEAKLQILGPVADSLKAIAKGYDVDENPISIVPDTSGDNN